MKFTSNINRVTLNGVNTLKTRIKNAGKAKRIAKAQDELRALATNEEVKFTSNINRVTLNGVNTLKNRIKNAGKAKRRRAFETLLNNYNVSMNQRMILTKRFEKGNRIDTIAAELKAKKNANKQVVSNLVTGAIKKAVINELTNTRIAYRNKVVKAKRAGLFPTQKEINNWNIPGSSVDYDGRTINGVQGELRKLQGYDKMLNKRLNELKREKNAKNKKPIYNASNSPPIRGDPRNGANPSGNGVNKNPLALEKKTNPTFVANNDNELLNARIAYRTNVLMAVREGRLPQNQEDYWFRQANTALNMSTIQGMDKMFKIHLEKMKREKNAATKIQAAFKGAQVRKNVGGASMGKDILKKHISGVNVTAGQKIPGFSGKRVERSDYERDWLKRVDEEGDTAVKRAKLRKMFDDKFELKKDLLQNEQKPNVSKAYKFGGLQLQGMKATVMRPRYKQHQSTKGTDQNLAIQNVKDIKDAILAARIKDRMNKLSRNYNNNMPKNTKSSGAFNMKGGFNGGIRLGSGGNEAINGSNAKPSLKNITRNKIIRPARMAGNTLIKAGQITQAKKNAVGNVAAARNAYTNQSKFALNQRKARAKKRVELSLKSEAGKNAARYKKMINEGKINAAMSEVDKKVMQLRQMGKKVEMQPKLT